MKLALLRALNEARSQRRAIAVETELSSGAQRLVEEGALGADPRAAALSKAFRTGRPASFEAEGRSFFVNVHLPPPRLVAIGAVHISQALAPMARIAGYDMEVVDPRTAFASPERFPDVPVFAEWPEDRLKTRPLDRYTALALLTHDPKIDDAPLIAGLAAGCFYVGALGSRKTHAARAARLLEAGVPEASLARIDAPIGLDIGAASPEEIAVSILGSVIAAFRRRGETERR